jgi:hypothetical protein
MPSRDLQDLLDEAIAAHGVEPVARMLSDLLRTGPTQRVLTIIANAGVHEIPAQYLRGEVYEASRGNWDATTAAALLEELTKLLTALGQKLREQQWERIYLIPTGHPILSLQIKSMVYCVVRMNTVDLYYKAGSYFEIDIDQRSVALGTGHVSPQK